MFCMLGLVYHIYNHDRLNCYFASSICLQQQLLTWEKISQAHNLMPAFSEEKQHYDKPVNIQPLAIIWQPFLACTLSVLLTSAHWGKLNRLTSPLLLRDPVTCRKKPTAQKQQDVVLLWACFGLSKIMNTVQALTCSSCCQICYNWQMQ